MRPVVLLLFLTGGLFAQPADSLSAVRNYARTYVEGLPNYTATQQVKRRTKTSLSPQLPPETHTDEMEEQIGYVNRQETHRIVRFNEHVMSDATPVRNEGVFSTGEFGGLLQTLSREDSGATFTPAKPEKIKGRPVDVFDFHVPAQPAGYGIKDPGRLTQVAFTGRLYADASSHSVLRIQFHCVDFPVTLNYKSLEMDLEFAPAKVGGRDYILPARYTLKSRRDDGEMSIEATYRNYQRFAADSTIIFDEP